MIVINHLIEIAVLLPAAVTSSQVYDPQTSTYSNAPGVEIRPVGWGDTSGMEYLDPNVRVGDAVMFGRLVDALVSSGGERGVSIRGAPYDFRTVPGAAYMAQLKELVEETVAANEGRPAVLLSHSMGCLVTLRFLRSMSPSWKRKFVKHWLAVSAPFGGSEGTVRLFASGNNMGVSAVRRVIIRLVPTALDTYGGRPACCAMEQLCA